MNEQETTDTTEEFDECSKPNCENSPIALFDNGVFQEPRCETHSSEWLTVVREL